MSTIKNGSIVGLEFAPNVKGRIVKTHLPEHGDITYDVQISYSFNPRADLERLRVRDVLGRCLIWESDEPLADNLPDDKRIVQSVVDELDLICVHELDPDMYKDHWTKVVVALKYAAKK